MLKSLLIVFALLAMTSCASYRKECNGDVCKITEGGKVRYEGNQEKIAQIEAAESGRQAKVEDLYKQLREAERRPKSEIIRVVLVPTSSQSMKAHEKKYVEMTNQALQKYSKYIEVMSYSSLQSFNLRMAMSKAMSEGAPSGSQSSSSSFSSANRKSPLETAAQEALAFGKADIVAVIEYGVKKKTGFVANKSGAGAVQVDAPNFKVSVTSAYRYKRYQKEFAGYSITSLETGGFTKKGEHKTGALKGMKRNTSKDMPALESAAKYVAKASVGLRKTMPSYAALNEIYGGDVRRTTASEGSKQKTVDALKSLFGK